MGISLSDIVQRQKRSLADFSEKVIAIDAHNVLYQFLANIRTADGSLLMDDQGRPTSHLTGLFSRTAKMVELGIKPIFVFDGKPHDLKSKTLAARRAVKEPPAAVGNNPSSPQPSARSCGPVLSLPASTNRAGRIDR